MTEPYQPKPEVTLPFAHQVQAALQVLFGSRLQIGARLERWTAARIGGPADVLLEVASRDELIQAVEALWRELVPFIILGGGSNVLVSERGVRGVVLVNRARQVRFDDQAEPPQVWAEAGANFGALARLAAARGMSGLEWAAGIPGTLGGAVVGNAGAHGGDMAGNLLVAEILQQELGREVWPGERLQFEYRSSVLKRQPGGSPRAVVLAATLRLERSTPAAVQARMDELVAFRRRTQPPGASMGSMFKNPPGDFAGRLIQEAGIKGLRIGGAQISPLHGNFFINLGQATARDVYRLMRRAQLAVAQHSSVELELEVELVGDWQTEIAALESGAE